MNHYVYYCECLCLYNAIQLGIFSSNIDVIGHINELKYRTIANRDEL